MISEKLDIRSTELNYRDPVSYYMARWFDEQFTVDVLNKTGFCGLGFTLASDDLDRHHIDYYFTGYDNKIHYVDSKIHVRGFNHPDFKTGRPVYIDAITVGEPAWNSDTEFFSFVYRGKIYFCCHRDALSIQPSFVRESIGQNGHKQNLFHFNVNDFINIKSTRAADIPPVLFSCYEDAYEIFARTRRYVYEFNYARSESEKAFNNKQRYAAIERMRDAFIPIIQKFNSASMMESGASDISGNLSDIYKLIG